MVKFVAYTSQDNRDLSDLGLFQNIKKNLTRKGEGKSFDATKGKLDMHVEGKGMFFVLKKPVSGTMDSVLVKRDGDKQYEVSGLDLKIRKMKDFFKGNYEKKIFSEADTITGSKKKDTLAGFDGADTIKGDKGGDKLLGGNGNDFLYGEAGNDTIKGGKGDDRLDGGDGKNTLTGGSGDDAFRFSSQLNAKNVSTITDFTIGEDRIELANAAFPSIGGSGPLGAAKFILSTAYAGEENVVVYDKATGELSYAVAANDLIAFGKVTGGLNLTYNDIFVV